MTNKADPGADLQAYQTGMSRRQSLKLMAALAASSMLPALSGCDTAPQATVADKTAAPNAALTQEHWPDLKLAPLSGPGYGKDPNLILPPESAWPLTLSAAQLSLLAVVADILVPRDGPVPSASEVGVPTVLDEWVSAPYPRQQQDRITVLSVLAWLDDEATMRLGSRFLALARPQQLAIIDDIAFDNAQTKPQFQRIAKAFALLRGLVVAAFFATPEGTKDIGYVGNTAIGGDYPGPTPQAKAHLDKILTELGLKEFAWQA